MLSHMFAAEEPNANQFLCWNLYLLTQCLDCPGRMQMFDAEYNAKKKKKSRENLILLLAHITPKKQAVLEAEVSNFVSRRFLDGTNMHADSKYVLRVNKSINNFGYVC